MGDAMTGIEDAVDNTFTRWGLTARPIMDRQQCAEVTAISLGLGALFNEDINAERLWMKQPRRELRGSASTAVLQGRTSEVLAIVNRERNL